MKNKRIISSILIVALAITYLFTPAHSLSGKIATVNSKKTVVSTMTFNGVKLKAYYGPYFSGYNSDMTSLGSNYGGYCCAGFVYQFYKRVYGITVNNLFAERNSSGYGSGINFKKSSLDGLYYNTPISSEGYFYRVAEPKVGDIVASDNHWAIAKKVSSSGTVTLIEQNYWYNRYSSALVDRKISKTNSKYWFFRYSGAKSVNVVEADEEKEDKPSEIWTVCSDNGINVRTGAGTNYSVKTAIPDGAIIHITDKKVVDGILWGECALGWCAIEYCDYVEGSCEKDSFIISFDTEYGSSSMDKVLLEMTESATLPKCEIKYKSKKFAGWKILREADNKWLYTNGKKQKWYRETKQPFGYEKVVIGDEGSLYGLSKNNNEKFTLIASFKKVKTKSGDLGFDIIGDSTYKSKGASAKIKVFKGSTYLKKGRDYTLSYKNNTSVGKAKVYVKLIGDYSGKISTSFTILPTSVKSLKATPYKKTVKLKWAKNKSAKGYQIYVKNPKTGKYKKLKTLTRNKLLNYKAEGLRRKTKYKFRVRAYNKVDGKYYYGDYKYITVTTK